MIVQVLVLKPQLDFVFSISYSFNMYTYMRGIYIPTTHGDHCFLWILQQPTT